MDIVNRTRKICYLNARVSSDEVVVIEMDNTNTNWIYVYMLVAYVQEKNLR